MGQRGRKTSKKRWDLRIPKAGWKSGEREYLLR